MSADTGGTSTGVVTTDDDDDDDKLDLADDTGSPQMNGCEAIDFLFVLDNSESMSTYQMALAEQFPDFITSMFDVLPEDIDVHVGLTTTDFDSGCAAAESTQNCQSTATVDEVMSHYQRPDEGHDGGNGTQGRLFEFAGTRYFETNSDDDPTELSDWFSQAAVAAGEDGCSFEMPVAAAGFVPHPANDATNAGFIRDEGALLVIFFLTDEPDKSPESKDLYGEMLVEAKANCGGADCIFVSGLVPTCVSEINQKLWQFMGLFDEQDEPPVGDIEATNDYTAVFGGALADTIAEQCAEIPVIP